MATRPAITPPRPRHAPRKPRPSEVQAREKRQRALVGVATANTSFTNSFDARDWAKEFVATARRNPKLATDEGTMLGWFANAIMRGYDEAKRRPAPDNARAPETSGLLSRAEESGIVRTSVERPTTREDGNALEVVNKRVHGHADQLGVIRERLGMICDRLGVPHLPESGGSAVKSAEQGGKGTVIEIGLGLETQRAILDQICVLVSRLERL